MFDSQESQYDTMRGSPLLNKSRVHPHSNQINPMIEIITSSTMEFFLFLFITYMDQDDQIKGGTLFPNDALERKNIHRV